MRTRNVVKGVVSSRKFLVIDYLICLPLAWLFATAAVAGPLDGLTPGEWYVFPNSKLQSVFPTNDPGPDPTAVIHAWSGGVYDSDRDRLVVWGGGHTDYAGNEVYAFGPLNVDNPGWQRLTEPSSPPADNALYASDGRPVSRHTYGLLDYLPDPYNKMMSCGVGSQYSNGYSNDAVDFFDFTINPAISNPWSKGANAPVSGYAMQGFCIYNPTTNRVWYHTNGSNSSRLMQYNPTTNSWSAHAEYFLQGDMTPAIDYSRNLLLATGSGYGLRIWDLNNPNQQSYAANTSGADHPMNGKAPGFIYDPVNDRFIGWNGGAKLYALTIPSDTVNGIWAWTVIPLDASNTVTPTGVAGAAYETGTFGRFRYVPSLNGIVVVSGTDENVYYRKLPGEGIGDGTGTGAGFKQSSPGESEAAGSDMWFLLSIFLIFLLGTVSRSGSLTGGNKH